MNANKQRRWIVILTAALLTTGCTPLELNKSKAWLFSNDDKPQTPTKVVALWTEAVRSSSDASAERGFGGRLTFYPAKGDKPVKVEGALAVYVFDEDGRKPGDNKPDRRYVFTKEEWSRHYSKSELGHSYSVWVPWDKVGGPKKEISLIVRFTPDLGPTIVSEQVRQVLPGEKALAADLPQGPQAGAIPCTEGAGGEQIALASHQIAVPQGSAAATTNPSTRQMTTTTIRMPSRCGQTSPVAETRGKSTRREPVWRQTESSPNAPARVGAALERTPLVSPAPQFPQPPQSRFGLDGLPVQAGQAAGQAADRVALQPRRAEPPSRFPRSPRAELARDLQVSAPADPSTSSQPGQTPDATTQLQVEDARESR